MTLKSSYSNYLKNTFKRKSWITVLSLLAFFLSLTLPALMIISNFQTRKLYSAVPAATAISDTCNSLTHLMDHQGFAIKIIFILLALVSGLSAFCYLHNRAKVDFYNSFSISRKAIFICNFIASSVPVIIGFLVNFIITHILIASLGYGQALMSTGIWVALAENLLYFFSIFAISALCTILCGNTIITLLLAVVAFFGQTAIMLLFSLLKGLLYQSFYFDARHLVKYSPVTQIFNNYSFNSYDKPIIFITYFIITVAVIGIALLLFVKRKSENSGVAIAFNKFKLPLKLYCCIIFGLGCGFLFSYFVGGQQLWIYFGAIFGILLAHALSEITFDFNFHSIFKNWKHGALLVILSCSVVLCMGLDITGFMKKTVEAENIKSFGFYTTSGLQSGDNELLSSLPLKSNKNIEAITEIIKSAVSFEPNLNPPSNNQYYNVGSEYFIANIIAKTSPFGSFKRKYFIKNNEENMALFDTIIYSDEYKVLNNKLFSDEALTSTELEIEYAGGNSYERTSRSGDMVKNIVMAVQEDYMNFTAEDSKNTSPVFLLHFSTADENKRFVIYDVPIFDNYDKTLTLLKEYFDIVPKKLTVDEIDRIEFYDQKYVNLSALNENDLGLAEAAEEKTIFTDKEDIELLIKNSCFSNLRYNFFKSDNRLRIDIFFKDNSISTSYSVSINDMMLTLQRQ